MPSALAPLPRAKTLDCTYSLRKIRARQHLLLRARGIHRGLPRLRERVRVDGQVRKAGRSLGRAVQQIRSVDPHRAAGAQHPRERRLRERKDLLRLNEPGLRGRALGVRARRVGAGTELVVDEHADAARERVPAIHVGLRRGDGAVSGHDVEKREADGAFDFETGQRLARASLRDGRIRTADCGFAEARSRPAPTSAARRPRCPTHSATTSRPARDRRATE